MLWFVSGLYSFDCIFFALSYLALLVGTYNYCLVWVFAFVSVMVFGFVVCYICYAGVGLFCMDGYVV